VGAFADAALVAGSFNDPANLAAVPARVLVGAGVSVDVPRWGLRLVCSGQNLADTPVWDMATWRSRAARSSSRSAGRARSVPRTRPPKTKRQGATDHDLSKKKYPHGDGGGRVGGGL
jgi:hypothetical protein